MTTIVLIPGLLACRRWVLGNDSLATYLPIHGAWHGAWCWHKLTPLLGVDGARVIAPDLPSMGADITPPNVIKLDYTERSAADIVEREPEPVTVVAHSRGGIVASRAAELVPDRM